jgi:V/A-type H+-transporting ATPase subunit I
MAVLPVEKIQIVVHKSIKEEFLRELQREGIVHITEFEETTLKTPAELSRIEDALNQITVYKKRHPLSMFFSMKRPMSYDHFVDSAESYDHTRTAEELENIKAERETLSTRARQLEDDITLLFPWQPCEASLESLRAFRKTESIPVMVPSSETLQLLSEIMSDIPHSIEHINTVGPVQYCLFFVKKDQSAALRAKLVENGCEVVDFRSHVGTPAKLIDRFEQELRRTRTRIQELNEKEKDLAKEILSLEAASDLLSIAQKKEELASALPETIRTVNIIGWILKRNLARLDRLIAKFGLVFYDKVEREPDERPPVALQNVTLSKPYEMLVKLYSMPNPREYDPTPFLAFFFPVMFGLCITDALYGVLLILISLYLMKRVTGDKSLFKILLVGGILTIFAGAMMGGWAGDIFEYIGFEPLIRFKNSFMLFDPIKQPMIFIALALGLGFIHMMLGIAIEIVDNIRNREYNQAIFANLTWFIILPSIILYFSVFGSSPAAKAILEIILWACLMGIIVASHPEGKSSPVDQIIWAIVIWILWYFGTSVAGKLLHFAYVIQLPMSMMFLLIPLIGMEIIRFRQMKGVLGKIAWGFYNIYGISNYLGVLLSYVRLMALGMVTGVIAIAINKIAWMITGIPVIGVVLVIIILIPSHLFNLIINTLGGFIHTMRLQYIEFFGRFYSGGSKPFKPFRMETNYVDIK